jgi:lysophospholipase L1-like esterase
VTGPVVVAMGDSITVGVGDSVGADAPHGAGWAGHLATLLGASTYLNLSRNGARARHLVTEQLAPALAAGPAVAAVLVGGNDVLRSDFSARDVARDLSTTVTALRGAGATVLLARLPSIGLFELAPGRVRRVMRARVDAVNQVVDAVAARAAGLGGHVVVLDFAGAVRAHGPSAWHIDRVHPSPAGHRQLAVAAAHELATAGLIDPPGDVALPAPPAPPSRGQRVLWLITAGIPWCVRRGRDFVPGLVRAVVDDLRYPTDDAATAVGALAPEGALEPTSPGVGSATNG